MPRLCGCVPKDCDSVLLALRKQAAPLLSSLPSRSSPQYPGWGRKKGVSLAVSCTSGGTGDSLTCPRFPPWRNHGEKVGPGTELCCHGETAGYSQPVPLTLFIVTNLVVVFLHQWNAGKSVSLMEKFVESAYSAVLLASFSLAFLLCIYEFRVLIFS